MFLQDLLACESANRGGGLALKSIALLRSETPWWSDQWERVTIKGSEPSLENLKTLHFGRYRRMRVW